MDLLPEHDHYPSAKKEILPGDDFIPNLPPKSPSAYFHEKKW